MTIHEQQQLLADINKRALVILEAGKNGVCCSPDFSSDTIALSLAMLANSVWNVTTANSIRVEASVEQS